MKTKQDKEIAINIEHIRKQFPSAWIKQLVVLSNLDRAYISKIVRGHRGKGLRKNSKAYTVLKLAQHLLNGQSFLEIAIAEEINKTQQKWNEAKNNPAKN